MIIYYTDKTFKQPTILEFFRPIFIGLGLNRKVMMMQKRLTFPKCLKDCVFQNLTIPRYFGDNILFI